MMQYYIISKGIEKHADGTREDIAVLTWHSFWIDKHQVYSRKAWIEVGKLMEWKT